MTGTLTGTPMTTAANYVPGVGVGASLGPGRGGDGLVIVTYTSV